MPRTRKRNGRKNVTAIVKREVASQLANNIERKNAQGFIFQSVSTTTFFAELLDLLLDPQGQSVSEGGWIGSEIRLQNMMVRWELAQADSTQSYRMIIFEPQPNYAPTTGSTALLETSAKPFISSLNREYVKRVYLDRVYFQGGTNSGGTQITRGRKFIKLRNRLVKFQQPGVQTVANVKLYCCLLSDSSVATHPSMAVLLDLSYTDA